MHGLSGKTCYLDQSTCAFTITEAQRDQWQEWVLKIAHQSNLYDLPIQNREHQSINEESRRIYAVFHWNRSFISRLNSPHTRPCCHFITFISCVCFCKTKPHHCSPENTKHTIATRCLGDDDVMRATHSLGTRVWQTECDEPISRTLWEMRVSNQWKFPLWTGINRSLSMVARIQGP